MPRYTNCALVISLAAGLGLGIAHLDTRTFGGRLIETESGTDPVLKRKLAQNDAVVTYKDYLVRELAAGRMTLTEVADEFLRVNAGDPAVLESVLWTYPGANDREKSAHNVIAFARGRCLTPAKETDVLARLTTEFAATFGYRPADAAT